MASEDAWAVAHNFLVFGALVSGAELSIFSPSGKAGDKESESALWKACVDQKATTLVTGPLSNAHDGIKGLNICLWGEDDSAFSKFKCFNLKWQAELGLPLV